MSEFGARNSLVDNGFHVPKNCGELVEELLDEMVEKRPTGRQFRDPNKVLVGVTHGRQGYRKGCGCDVCTGTERDYQQKRKAEGLQPRNGQSFRKVVDVKSAARAQQEAAGNVTQLHVLQGNSEPTPPPASSKEFVGPVEASIIEECAGLSIAVERPGVVEMARCLARILDDKKSIGLWPTTSRQLQVMLNDLRGNSKRKTRGRIAKVQNMTRAAR